jgi:hypothetical protein
MKSKIKFSDKIILKLKHNNEANNQMKVWHKYELKERERERERERKREK